MKKIIVLLIALVGFPLASYADPLVVGVLEQPQCKEQEKTMARLLFVKVGSRWISLDDEYQTPKNLNLTKSSWTIAFDGRNLGTIKLIDPNPNAPILKDWYYGRDKLYEPVNLEKLPKLKNTSSAFSGWCSAPAIRPLVLVSHANYSDPERWKPFSPDHSYVPKLFEPLKLAIGNFKVVRCKQTKDGERAEPWDYKSKDLVLYKSYRSKSGLELVSIGIDHEKSGCEFLAEPQWSRHLFLIDGKKIEFLGSQMELLDAGDYDKDGRSEFLFWYSSYNKDGYVLVYDGRRQKAEYLWSYH